MKLKWIKQEHSMNIFVAESAKYRYTMVAPPRTNAALTVQPIASDPGDELIAERTCRTRRGAERYAQRFENNPKAKRL